MRDSIDQFMWGFQPHFRSDLENRAQDALSSIGLAVSPRALLIGFAEFPEARHSICIEPETGPFVQADFGRVLARADELFANDEERHVLVTGPGQQEQFEARSLDKVRRAAIREAVMVADPSGELMYWVGPSALVSGYRVFPVLSVIADRWQPGPLLPEYATGGLRLQRSFADQVILRLLDVSATSLTTGEQPQRLTSIGYRAAEDVVRAAARSFLDGIPLRVGAMPADLFDRLNELAATPYEGKPTTGSLIFLPQSAATSLSIAFTQPVSTSRTRQARKLLEMSGASRPLVSNGGLLFGLAGDAELATTEYRVDFFKRTVWVLSYLGEPIFRSSLGRASLPTPHLDRGLFEDNFERIFGTEVGSDVDAVWSLIDTASDQGHGTMVVIHRAAATEAERLGDQAVRVAISSLIPDALSAATSIDGAILVAPDGACHAIGVILDGVAGGSGDPGRGARFNSAARYADQHRAHCLILVVSDDGSVEVVPRPRRRVRRTLVEQIVADVEDAAQEPIDFEATHRLFARAEAHAFYMTAEQCARLVEARETVEESRSKSGGLRLLGWAVEPDPKLDESYFLD